MNDFGIIFCFNRIISQKVVQINLILITMSLLVSLTTHSDALQDQFANNSLL